MKLKPYALQSAALMLPDIHFLCGNLLFPDLGGSSALYLV